MKYFTFNNMESSGAVHAFYTGIADSSWGFNEPEDYNNYLLLGQMFNINPDRMIRTNQTHTTNVRVITSENAGEGVLRTGPAEGSDAMVTNVPGLMLLTVEADCVPVYLLDPENKAIAIIHSGWKGTAGKISANAVNAMKQNYGTAPSKLIAAIAPCICRDCYEVTGDLMPEFAKSFSEKEICELFTLKPNGRYWLDLKKAISMTLTECGVKNSNIEDSGYCTMHSSENGTPLFCSWRRDAIHGSRMLTGIVIK